jgi:hypothetical protein
MGGINNTDRCGMHCGLGTKGDIMADFAPPSGSPHSPQRWHIVPLFLAYQIPLAALIWWFGPCSLWQTAEYNLAGITAWCVLRRYVWKESANCMACSLFCTFTVWTLHVIIDTLQVATAFAGMKALLTMP